MKRMKLHALALVAALSLANSAYAIQLNHTDTLGLGSFGANATWVDSFSVGSAGQIDHSLTFSILTNLYAGSGVSDIPLSFMIGPSNTALLNINSLSAEIFDSNNISYVTFIQNGDPDHLILPTNSYFAAGNYTLKIGGTATGISGGLYSVAAVTVPVPEPETYAMLLVGLGLVGYRLRQKNRAAGQASLN